MKKRWYAAAAVMIVVGALATYAGQKTSLGVSADKPRECPWAQAEKVKLQAEAELARAAEKLTAELAEAEARMARELAEFDRQHAVELSQELARMDGEHARWIAEHAEQQAKRAAEEFAWFSSDEESGWMGVSISEVSAEKARELKLVAERGVLVKEVEADSPAAKAGLKENDVIVEYNGERIEGTVQFRRLVRETPAGRTAQISIWREGRAQNLPVVLGSRRSGESRSFSFVLPQLPDFKMRLPEVFAYSESLGGLRTPLLGISGEDLRGQLGQYFGAPDGQGVLVREVSAGSAAEKAGMKSGDVITKVAGQRVRTLSELRSALREKREEKSLAVTVIRKGAETALTVEIEPPKRLERKIVSRRITL